MNARRPPIAVSLSKDPPRDRPLFKNKALQYLEEGMIRALAAAGGSPILLPDLGESEAEGAGLELCRGLLLSGGADLSPGSYGEEPLRPEWSGEPRRDAYEFALYRRARDLGIPVLGICRGCQVLNVAEGGALWQDLETQREDGLVHRDQEVYDACGHPVAFPPGSLLAAVYGDVVREVNSVHHQGLRELGERVRPLAFAPDGLCEAIEIEGDSFLVGLQWHPEWMPGPGGEPDPIFRAFVEAAS